MTERFIAPLSTRWQTAVRLVFVAALLYAFLAGVKSLELGIRAFGSDFADRVFENVTNPVAGLFAGILATVLVQSSSVSTSTIVGLVGAGALPLVSAVPMVMGANIGTTVTNTLVSLGHVRQGPEFRRAFAGATVHDFFNVLTVLIALPLELATGFLSRSAEAVTELLGREQTLPGVEVDSPIKAAVAAPIELLEGALAAASPATTGTVLLVVGLGLILASLNFITRNMRELTAAGIERSLNRMLDKGAGLGAMLVGIVVTILVQSSSITTSILIPMLAAGIITLPNAYPVTLGANLGTTLTALLASMAAASPDALTIALVHTFFNVFGILIFYPVPLLRFVPIRLAEVTADAAQNHRSWVAVYVGGMFLAVPLLGVMILA